MSKIWNAVSFSEVLEAVEDGPLPECNRGSWFCPVATESDAQALDRRLEGTDIERVYDLGAGYLAFSVAMDKRGYDVIAYESISDLVEYGLERLPDNDVEVRTRDYYADWNDIKDDSAAFVALGKLNRVPGEVENGIVVDAMGVDNNNL